MSPTRRGPQSVRAPEAARTTARAPPATGPTPPRASMAIFSTSSPSIAGLDRLRDTLDEARAFLALPPEPDRSTAGSSSGATRFARVGAASLRHVAADHGHACANLPAQPRHHDLGRTATRCASIRAATTAPDEHCPTETWPALIAAVTDLGGRLTGAHRTWLDPRRATTRRRSTSPRRAMGDLLGHGVRFGVADDVMAAGRRHRDHAVAAHASCRPADGGRALGQPPRRPAASTDTAPSLYRPRSAIRPVMPRWPACAIAPTAAGIEALVLSPVLRRLQRAISAAWDRRAPGIGAPAARPAGRGALPGLGRRREEHRRR